MHCPFRGVSGRSPEQDAQPFLRVAAGGLEKWWWRRETLQGFCGYSATLPCLLTIPTLLYYISAVNTVLYCFRLVVGKERRKADRKRRRKPQTLTAEQFEVFRTRLDERGDVPPPQHESYMMGEIVRGVYPQLKKLRENGYTLKMLVRVFEENGVVITIHALSTYLKNLALPREQAPAKAAIKGTVGSATVEARRGQFQMKPDVTL